MQNGQGRQKDGVKKKLLYSTALSNLADDIELNLNMVLAKGTSKLADVLVGTNGAKNVRIQASDMFNKYTRMVDTYHYAEDSMRGNIEDFTS